MIIPRLELERMLSEYGVSHRHPVNVAIHSFAVPCIFFATLGLLYAVPNPVWVGTQSIRFVHVVELLSMVYYLKLAPRAATIMLISIASAMLLCRVVDSLFGACAAMVWAGVFIVSWVLQFYGHKLEGQRPSFMKDLQFLLIGPLWVLRKFRLI